MKKITSFILLYVIFAIFLLNNNCKEKTTTDEEGPDDTIKPPSLGFYLKEDCNFFGYDFPPPDPTNTVLMRISAREKDSVEFYLYYDPGNDPDLAGVKVYCASEDTAVFTIYGAIDNKKYLQDGENFIRIKPKEIPSEAVAKILGLYAENEERSLQDGLWWKFVIDVYKNKGVNLLYYYRVKDPRFTKTTPRWEPTEDSIMQLLNFVYRQGVSTIDSIDSINTDLNIEYDENGNYVFEIFNYENADSFAIKNMEYALIKDGTTFHDSDVVYLKYYAEHYIFESGNPPDSGDEEIYLRWVEGRIHAGDWFCVGEIILQNDVPTYTGEFIEVDFVSGNTIYFFRINPNNGESLYPPCLMFDHSEDETVIDYTMKGVYDSYYGITIITDASIMVKRTHAHEIAHLCYGLSDLSEVKDTINLMYKAEIYISGSNTYYAGTHLGWYDRYTIDNTYEKQWYKMHGM